MSVAICTLQSEFILMRQEHTEPFAQFSARVRGKAMNGKFKKSVTCSNGSCARLAEVDFTEEIVKMVVLTRLLDDDIKRKD